MQRLTYRQVLAAATQLESAPIARPQRSDAAAVVEPRLASYLARSARRWRARATDSALTTAAPDRVHWPRATTAIG